MATMFLSDMKVGQRGKIVGMYDYAPGIQRIQEMGVTAGETVEVVRYAPLGDPMEIRIRGYLLSLRREEARSIEVTIPN